MEEKRFYTVEQIANMLHVTTRTVYSWIKAKKLTAVHIGRRWQIAEENLNEFLKGEN